MKTSLKHNQAEPTNATNSMAKEEGGDTTKRDSRNKVKKKRKNKIFSAIKKWLKKARKSIKKSVGHSRDSTQKFDRPGVPSEPMADIQETPAEWESENFHIEATSSDKNRVSGHVEATSSEFAEEIEEKIAKRIIVPASSECAEVERKNGTAEGQSCCTADTSFAFVQERESAIQNNKADTITDHIEASSSEDQNNKPTADMVAEHFEASSSEGQKNGPTAEMVAEHFEATSSDYEGQERVVTGEMGTDYVEETSGSLSQKEEAAVEMSDVLKSSGGVVEAEGERNTPEERINDGSVKLMTLREPQDIKLSGTGYTYRQYFQTLREIPSQGNEQDESTSCHESTLSRDSTNPQPTFRDIQEMFEETTKHKKSSIRIGMQTPRPFN